MVKLRHLAGDNLKQLEKDLEKIKHPVVVLNVTKAGMTWFIHFLIQDVYQDEKIEAASVKMEVVSPTKKLKT